MNKKFYELDNFVKGKTVRDIRYGKLTVLKHKITGQKIAVSQKVYKSEKEFKTGILMIKKRMKANHPNLLKLVDFSTKKKTGFCSKFYVLKKYFEYPELDAKYAAAHKKKNGTRFSSGEMTHILYNCVDGGAHLQRNQMCHGNITPYNIAIFKKDHYKLMDAFEDLEGVRMHQEEMVLGQDRHYTSPEKYNAIVERSDYRAINPSKNDVFGLGLSLIELTTNENTGTIYRPNGSVDKARLANHLESFKHSFSGSDNVLLISTVSAMVNLNMSERPDFIQIQDNLPPYDEVKSFLSVPQNGVGNQPNGGQNTTYNQVAKPVPYTYAKNGQMTQMRAVPKDLVQLNNRNQNVGQNVLRTSNSSNLQSQDFKFQNTNGQFNVNNRNANPMYYSVPLRNVTAAYQQPHAHMMSPLLHKTPPMKQVVSPNGQMMSPSRQVTPPSEVIFASQNAHPELKTIFQSPTSPKKSILVSPKGAKKSNKRVRFAEEPEKRSKTKANIRTPYDMQSPEQPYTIRKTASINSALPTGRFTQAPMQYAVKNGNYRSDLGTGQRVTWR